MNQLPPELTARPVHPRVIAVWLDGFDAGIAHATSPSGPGSRTASARGYDAGYAAGLAAGYERRDAEVIARANQAAALALGRVRPRPMRFGPAKPLPTAAECLASWNLPAHTIRTAA